MRRHEKPFLCRPQSTAICRASRRFPALECLADIEEWYGSGDERRNEQQELEPEELDTQDAGEGPDREVMSVMHPGSAPVPIEPLPLETL
jgi:hypothetical protein